jgi:hypothetical protein
MFRKILAALLIAVAIATATGVVPEIIQNVAYACIMDVDC